MKLYEILTESFQLLREEPRFFVPRLISTGISTIWFILVFENYVLSFSGLQFSMLEMVLYLVSGPLIVLIGVFVSIMLAYMVENGPDLGEGFWYTFGRYKSLLAVTLGILVLGVLVSLPLSSGIVLYPLLGMPFIILTALVSILLLVATSFAIYFLPIAVVENNQVFAVLKDSVRSSRENSREVVIMLMFSLVLLAFAGLAQGSLQTLGYVGFVLSRFLSALTTTYLFVVSPKMYIYSKN